jgi:6-phosphofructokinase
MRLGILTGGGDVPGLNACMKAASTRILEEGFEIIGIKRGWGGLLNYNPDNPKTHEELILPLTKTAVRTIDRTGGSF